MINYIFIGLSLIMQVFFFLFRRKRMLLGIYVGIYLIALGGGLKKILEITFRGKLKEYRFKKKDIYLIILYYLLLTNVVLVGYLGIIKYKVSLGLLIYLLGLMGLGIAINKGKETTHKRRVKELQSYLKEIKEGKETIRNKDLEDIKFRYLNKYLEIYENSLKKSLFLRNGKYLFYGLYGLIGIYLFRDYSFQEKILMIYLGIYVIGLVWGIKNIRYFRDNFKKVKNRDYKLINDFKVIEFRNLTIEGLISNFNLKIKNKEHIYIVKDEEDYSKFLDIFMEGNYKGKVYVDKYELRKIDLSNILMLDYYKPVFRDGSILDNILYNKEISNRKFNEYVRDYLPKEFMKSLEDEEGSNIKVLDNYPLYYKKLVSLLRSVISDKEILIMDEPILNLSKDNQERIENKLSRLDKTVIIFSKNMPINKNYDKIIVLSNKEIKETGTYEELVNKKRDFYRLINR